MLTDFSIAGSICSRTPIPENPCARVRPEPTLAPKHVERQISTGGGGVGPDKTGRRVGRPLIAFDQQISNRVFDPTRISMRRRELSLTPTPETRVPEFGQSPRWHLNMSNGKSRRMAAGLVRTKLGRRVGRFQIAFDQQISNREVDPTRISRG
jgi:hypothetical protein